MLRCFVALVVTEKRCHGRTTKQLEVWNKIINSKKETTRWRGCVSHKKETDNRIKQVA